MKMKHFLLNWIYICILINAFNAEEAVIQINTKKPIHLISEKFLSFSVDPELLIDGNPISEQVQNMAHSLSPAYLRISGKSTNRCRFKYEEDNIAVKKDNSRFLLRVTPSMWQALHEWLKLADMTPVIALDYDSENWQPKEVIELMGLTKDLGVHQCVWQLGNEINTTTVQKYTEDISTLKTIANAFSDGEEAWSVAGSDIVPGRSTDKIRTVLYKWQRVLDAVTWNPKLIMNPVDPLEEFYTDKDALFRSLVKTQSQIWLSQSSRYVSSVESNICTNKCLVDGLLWAQSLGDAAKQGFSVIFKQLQKNDYATPNFIYFISLLHKKLVGTKVLDTKVTNTDRTTSHFYAHCSSNITDDILGGMTVFGINMADEKLKTTLKMTAKIRGGEIWQYILTVKDNDILLNGENVNIERNLEPAVKFIRPSKPISLLMPANSVGFWVLPHIQTRACLEESLEEGSESDEGVRISHKSKTSSAALLQQLILESLNRHNEVTSRRKRQIDPLKGLGRKISRRIQDNAKTKSTRKSKLPSSSNLATVMGSDDDLYKLTSAERQIFQPRENENLPRGDVHFEVGSNSMETDQEYDYIQSNETPRKAKKKSSQHKKNDDYEMEWVNDNEELEINNFPNEFYENLPVDDYTAKQQQQQQPREFGELGEALYYDNNLRPQYEEKPISVNLRSFKRNTFKTENTNKGNIVGNENVNSNGDIYVMKELQPTIRQNLEQIGKTKQNLRNYFSNGNADEESIEFHNTEQDNYNIQAADKSALDGSSEYYDEDFAFESADDEDFGRFKRSIDGKMDMISKRKFRDSNDKKSVSKIRRNVGETGIDGAIKNSAGEGHSEAVGATIAGEVGDTLVKNHIEKTKDTDISDVEYSNKANKETIQETKPIDDKFEDDVLDVPLKPKDKTNYKIRLEKPKKKYEASKHHKGVATSIQKIINERENEKELSRKIVKRDINEKYTPIVQMMKISKNKRKPLRFEHKLKKQIEAENKVKYNKKKDKYLNNDDWESLPLYNRLRRNAIIKDFSWEDELYNIINKNENQGPFSNEFIMNLGMSDDKDLTKKLPKARHNENIHPVTNLVNSNNHMKKIKKENDVSKFKSKEMNSKFPEENETNSLNLNIDSSNDSYQNIRKDETNSNTIHPLTGSSIETMKSDNTDNPGVVRHISNKIDTFLNLIRDHINGWWRLFTQH